MGLLMKADWRSGMIFTWRMFDGIITNKELPSSLLFEFSSVMRIVAGNDRLIYIGP